MIITSYVSTLKQVFNYNGRTIRRDFWIYNLLNLGLLIVWLFLRVYFRFDDVRELIDYVFSGIVMVLLIPGIALSVRRLHDISRSGWYLCLNLVPVVGQLLLLVYYLTDSSPAYNQYGEYPKFKPNEF